MTVLPSSTKFGHSIWHNHCALDQFVATSDEELLAAIDWGLLYATPDGWGLNASEQETMEDFLCRQSHLFSAFGFSEVRQYKKSKEANLLLEPIYRTHWKNRPPFFNRDHEVLMRSTSSGPWNILAISAKDDFPALGRLSIHIQGQDGSEQSIGREEFVLKVANWLTPCLQSTYQLSLNTPLAPPHIESNRIQIVGFSQKLLQDLHEERISLRELHWRQLEELVAELLKREGFKVELGPGSHDGGRDVVASGEFFPGHKTTMAVQVKQRQVVNIGELAETLYRNSNYPLIMVATSGRFSAGVTQEQRRENNSLRLILEDGASMRRWIGRHNKLPC